MNSRNGFSVLPEQDLYAVNGGRGAKEAKAVLVYAASYGMFTAMNVGLNNCNYDENSFGNAAGLVASVVTEGYGLANGAVNKAVANSLGVDTATIKAAHEADAAKSKPASGKNNTKNTNYSSSGYSGGSSSSGGSSGGSSSGGK